MALIKRSEDIQAWQEVRKLVQQVYQMTNSDTFARDFGLKDQKRRSAVEVQSLLYTAADIGYGDAEVFRSIYEQAEKTKALTGAFMHSIRQHIKSSAR
jgi:hypothetical protein